MSFYTTAQVADMLGLSIPAVKVIRKRLDVGVKVGRDWLFTDEDVQMMRDRPDGRVTRWQKGTR